MVAMCLDEIQSFASKFAHLTSLGFDGSLTFDNNSGKIRASLIVNLGSICQEVNASSSSKPSKIRRKRRRQIARNNNPDLKFRIRKSIIGCFLS